MCNKKSSLVFQKRVSPKRVREGISQYFQTKMTIFLSADILIIYFKNIYYTNLDRMTVSQRVTKLMGFFQKFVELMHVRANMSPRIIAYVTVGSNIISEFKK